MHPCLGAAPKRDPRSPRFALALPCLELSYSPICSLVHKFSKLSKLSIARKMLNLYPPSTFDVYKKARLHYPLAITAACEEIHKACEGIGTDDKALVKILGPLSPNDRQLVAQRYLELHGQSLRDLIKSETSGDLGNLLQLISFSMPQAEAYILFHAMKGAGTSDHLLYSVSDRSRSIN